MRINSWAYPVLMPRNHKTRKDDHVTCNESPFCASSNSQLVKTSFHTDHTDEEPLSCEQSGLSSV